ncbi:MAG: UpxY family transcription antiterminator, partial [Lutibacter sp.]|nr:UpxY family transcription antiterminator [Lutibacter sp.]
FVLCTKPKNEKKVLGELISLGIKAYCPMVLERRQWSDRVKKVIVPLIPSYVFVKLPEQERDIVFRVPGIVRYLFWLGKPATVYDKEIEALKAFITDDTMDVTVQSLKPGDSYTISDGYFKGKEGVINEVTNNRLQLIINGLGIKITLKKA